MDLIRNIQSYIKSSINFYDDKIYHSLGIKGKNTPLHIKVVLETFPFKRILVDKVLTINFILKVAFQ